MTGRTRRNHSPAFKSKVTSVSIKGKHMLAERAKCFDAHPNQIDRVARVLSAVAKRLNELLGSTPILIRPVILCFAARLY